MNDFKSFAAELACDPWAMEPARLEALLSRLSEPMSVAGPIQQQQRRSRMIIQDGIATIPISGVLVRSMPRAFAFWGIEATTYQEIEEDIDAALADDSVSAIRLAISSPGGQVAGVKEAADAIAEAGRRKKVRAEISEIGASAAYWLASQAGRVDAAPNALVGSIGVYSAYIDLSRLAENAGVKVHLIASGALKGMGVPGTRITEPQLEAMQEVVNGMAAGFKADVVRGRRIPEKDVEALASGRVWTAEQAVENRLVDGITRPNAKKGPAGGPSAASDSPEGEEETMDPKQIAADQDKIRSEAAAQTREAEKARVATIRAAFPKDPMFAMDQIAAGATLDQAKAAYADVLEAKLAESEKGREAAEKKAAAPKPPAPPAKGGHPIVSEGEPGSQATEPEGFLSRSEKLAVERGWTKTQAMSHLARTEPALYEKYLEDTGAGAIVAKRREMDQKTGARR